jgi:alpha-beta hydrolase superfamily lysophospholipase
MGSIKPLIAIGAAGLIIFNAMVYKVAEDFFRYSATGTRLPPIEQLAWKDKIRLPFTGGLRLPKPRAHSAPDRWGLPFEEISAPGRDGLTLAGWIIPVEDADTTVVIFHGYNSEKSGLLPEARLFNQMGFETLLVDFPGAGGSPGFVTSLGIYEALDVAAVFDWVKKERPDHRVVLYGHSMGAAAVMRAMAKHGVRPDVAVIESGFDTLLGAIRNRFRLAGLPPSPAAEILLFWGSVQLRANGFAHRPIDFAADITAPTMIIHGKKDDRADWQGAVAIFNRLSGKKSLLLIDAAGHVNPSSFDPKRWLEDVSSFIR